MRLVLAVSLDGRLALPHGGAAQLGRDGDRRVLEQALAWADACLIGAGTLRAHECTCLIQDQMLVQQRLQKGRPAQPAAVVVMSMEGVVVVRLAAVVVDLKMVGRPLRSVLVSVLLLVAEY